MSRIFSLIVATVSFGPVLAQEGAVVRITSHGGSGTVIATGEDWTVILSCSHMFQGGDRGRPIVIDAPFPKAGKSQKVGIRLIGVAVPGEGDLSVLQVNAGPFPYVAPVAPEGFAPGQCWSVGYDEMRGFPAMKRPATVVGSGGPTVTLTTERPWHGRSGGGLIDAKTGYLVGVVSAYEGPSNRAERASGYHGVYVSHRAIFRFLRRTGHIRDAGGLPPSMPRSFQRHCPT